MPDRTLTDVVTICTSCSCGGSHSGACTCGCNCPEIGVDASAAPDKSVVINDDFGGEVRLSANQLRGIVDSARAGELDAVGGKR